MTLLLIGIFLICLSLVVYFAGRVNVLKQKVREKEAAVAAANSRLGKVEELLKMRKRLEGDARDEKQSLEDTPDNGLADRADSLFP